MNKSVLISIIASVVIGGAGVTAYFVMRNSDSIDTVSSDQKSSTKASVFRPASTLDKDFKATIEAESQDLEVRFEYDTDSKSVHYTTLTGDRTFESIITPDAYFSQINGSWVKYPVSQEQSGGFNPDDYQYKDEELRDYKSNVKYIGKKSCSEGKCNVWTADTPTSKSTFYVSTKDNYIIKVETVIDKKTTTINYDYQDVEVKAPADASELPDFRSSL